MSISFVIVEAYELDGEAIEDHGRRFSYFGTAHRMRSFFGFFKTVDEKLRFYATPSGECYDFANGDHMPNTTRAFRQHLHKRAIHNMEMKYIGLLERAKTID